MTVALPLGRLVRGPHLRKMSSSATASHTRRRYGIGPSLPPLSGASPRVRLEILYLLLADGGELPAFAAGALAKTLDGHRCEIG